jgi:H/ACA ribonucleoprotein complex subunit 4
MLTWDIAVDPDIQHNDEVVLMTCKGEAIAIGISLTSEATMLTMAHGEIAKVKRVYVPPLLSPPPKRNEG